MAAEEEIKPEVKAELDSAHQEAQRVQALRQKFAKKRKIEELKKQALFAASKSTFGKALSCISAAVNLDPSDIDAWGHRARLFLMMGNIDAAIMDCENAMREAFKRKFTGKALGDIHALKAEALILLKKPLKALETLMVGAAYGDGSHNVVQQLATLNENLQNEKACWAVPDEALVFDGLQTLKKERPVRDSAFEDAAETFFKSRDFKRAAEKYTEAIKIDLQNIDLYTRRAQCQEQLKNFSGVIQDCNRCLVLNRKAVEPHLLKGRAYLVQGQIGEAQKVYSLGLVHSPEHAELLEGSTSCQLAAEIALISNSAVQLHKEGRFEVLCPASSALCCSGAALRRLLSGAIHAGALEHSRRSELCPVDSSVLALSE
ncbi:hypothetical protein CYMTET_31180 [Cymbomonas tetramitiformis]|uniref:Uncharacterized protein n=1 Tax=Cymbomonas tetramitiformis TaxID=36881 RepID=A0AAE0FHH3_9CHLO|nr:hypothetical protein CYMTET_31180 [Cymbomonas tetramitiformis]